MTSVLTALAVTALAVPALAVRDLPFMKGAAQGGMTEVVLGHMAARKGTSRAVRQFGMQMVRDHSQANRELMRIARREGVALPTGLGPKNNALRARLSRLHGAAFDRAYARAMVADHQEDLREFRHEASSGRNPAVRTFADKYQAVIQGHLIMAQNLGRRDERG
jgi:putative membrane protein